MTVTDTMRLDLVIVQAWKATGGTFFEGTLYSRPGTDFRTACDTMIGLVQRNKTITLTIFISTTGPLFADDVQGFADFTGKVVTIGHGTAKPPYGFEEIPTDWVAAILHGALIAGTGEYQRVAKRSTGQ